MDWKPAGYPEVSPYLVVADAQRVIDFLGQVFGATPLRRYDGDDGGIVHAELRIASSVVMIADAAGDWPPVPCNLHVYVEDVDAVWKRALAAGAEPIQPPEQKGDADRRGGFRDPGGNSWWIATQVDQAAPAT